MQIFNNIYSWFQNGEFATSLSWRYVEFEIFLFSFFEYIAYKKLEINREIFLDYIT
jgi:predicted AAA+ superfamily ATPase